MKITELKKSSAERFIIKFDDGTELISSLAVITDLYLHSDMELSEAEYGKIVSLSARSLCKARALRMINMRPLSKKELISKLTEKGEDYENALYCAEWLCEMRLIDDASYAASLVRHYAAKGYGLMRIKQELNRHGIPREMWDEALEEMPSQDDYLERFISTRLKDPSDRAQQKKLSDALLRKGYSWSEIRHALNSYLSQEEL